jgi:hypothetical protein
MVMSFTSWQYLTQQCVRPIQTDHSACWLKQVIGKNGPAVSDKSGAGPLKDAARFSRPGVPGKMPASKKRLAGTRA